ncbi:MAG TPA: ABC transporter permease [Streptosporangiaceae bacterium]|nr:ABC transporter permease [Streptosporangiaceae bacterium]
MLWQAAVVVFHVPGYLLPAPTTVVTTLLDDRGELLSQSIPTLIETLGGFALSVPVGLGLAVLIVASRPIEKAIYPLLVTSQVVPKVAIAPLFLVWFGLGLLPKILITFLIAFFPIVIESAVGLRSVPVEMLDLARSMGSSRSQVFWRFRFPYALPSIFGGLKVGITLSVIGSIVGEFVGADRGLGYLLTVASGQLDTALVFAAIFVLVVMGVVLYGVIDFAERAVVKWHPSVREQHVSATGAA